MKILLAEDSGFMRVALERGLVKAGHLVSTVSDGDQAVRMIADKLPDLVLLDMMLPKLSGPNVLTRLKSDPSTKHIPIVVLTSLSQKNEAKLLEAGAAAYVVKSDKLLENDSESLLRLVAAFGPESQAAGAGE
jgi:CheY-like chemotaxis protein